MSRFTGNWIDRIGAIIPGYRGYKDKEMRRDTDRLVRTEIARLLADRRPALDQAIADLARSGKIEHLDRLDRVKRQMDNVATLVRTAPQGYSGFFDTVQVTAEDLDRLYEFDLTLRGKAAAVAEAAGALRKDPGATDHVLGLLSELERLVQQREHVLSGGP